MASRRNAILFFIFMLLLSGGGVLWHFFLDRGFVEISGETPFTVSVGVFKKYKCEKSPCRIPIEPKTYNLTGIKEGYFDAEEEVKVKLFRTQAVKFQFQFKPVVKEIGKVELPAILRGKDVSVPMAVDFKKLDLSKIPKNASRVLFSDSGRKAIVWLGKETYLYEDPENAPAVLSKISLPVNEAILWGSDEKLFLLTTAADKNGQLFLAAGAQDLIATFRRPLALPEISRDPQARYFVFQDQKGTYMVDTEKKIKQGVGLPDYVTNVRLVGGNFVLLTWKEGKLALLSIENLLKNQYEPLTEIPALHENAMTSTRNGIFFFIGTEPAHSQELGIPISKILDVGKENLEKVKRADSAVDERWHIVSYDPRKNVFLTLTSMAYEPEEVFLGFDTVFAEKGIFFETFRSKGKIRFFLQLEK